MNISNNSNIAKENEQQDTQIRNIFQENLASIQKMKQKVQIGLQSKEIWNENLLTNMIQKAEDYLANQYIQVVFLGVKNSGKTTLLNSILEDEIVPYQVGKSNHSQIIIQVGYRKENNITITRCNPQTFKPIEEVKIFESPSVKDIHQFIESSLQQDSNGTLQGQSQEEYIAMNNSLKVFQIRTNSTYFENFPEEIRNNIFFVDTPGIVCNERSQQQIYISQLKNLQQNSSPTIKYYLWITSFCDKRRKYEKTIFENVCYQLHLQEKNKQLQYQRANKEGEIKNLNSEVQQSQNVLQSDNIQASNDSYSKENNLFDSQKSALLEQICNVIKTSSNVSESDQTNFLSSVNSKFSQSLKENQLTLKSSGINDEVQKPIEVFQSDDVGEEEEDFWVIDKSQAQRDDQEVKLRNEQICFLRAQKIHRQLVVIFNSREEKQIFAEQGSHSLKKQDSLNEIQLKYLNMLEKSLQKPVVKVSALPALFCKVYQKYKNDKILEQEITKKFFSFYKDSLKLKSEKDAKKLLMNITLEQEPLLNIVGFENDSKSQNASKITIEQSTDLSINISQIKASHLPSFQRYIFRQINDLYDYKQMKKRLRIQEIVDKSSIKSKNYILNQQKRDQIEQFVIESLPIIHNNHQQMIQSNLNNIYASSLEYRKNTLLPKIEEIYSNHKSYQIFDKTETQLNQAILEYFSESVQNLAVSMVTGDKLIETHKDGILYEINEIDPQLSDGIKSIIIDFKKRSLQDANNLITSNLCVTLQQNFSFLGSIIGASSLFTGLSVVLQSNFYFMNFLFNRIAGRSIMGAGPLGLGVAVGMTILSTIFFVNKREKKLQESKQLIIEFFDRIEEEQQKIHSQLIQSYTKVYNEVILVISDYLKGISTLNLKQLIDEQKNLNQQDKEINTSNKKYSSQLEDSSDSDSNSDSESEYPEDNSPRQDPSNEGTFKSALQQNNNDPLYSSFQSKEQEVAPKFFNNSNNQLFYSHQSSHVNQCVSDLEITQLQSSPSKSFKLDDLKEEIENGTEQNFKSILERQIRQQHGHTDFESSQNGNFNDSIKSQEGGQDVFYSFSSIDNNESQ